MAKKSSIVIVSNRLPVHRAGDGKSQRWEISPGGLVSALTPILRDQPSTWIGWTGAPGPAPKPFEHEGIYSRPVALSEGEIRSFYEGFSNRTLWPLYHDCVRPPEYHRRWWWPYVEVNRRFAAAAADAVDEGGLVWVHDYHLQLVPAMLREMRPDARIGFFLHIPFPPVELFTQLPWRRQILEGLLGADVVGFQTPLGAQNFARLARRFTDATGSRERLRYWNRTIRADAFPISINVKRFEEQAALEVTSRRSQKICERMGPTRKVILGVDRLDYTKGIDIRLKAFQDLLQSGKVGLNDVVFVQVAVPSRERVEEYRELRSEVERIVGEINGEFGELGRTAVHYLHRNLPFEQLVALYRAADVMLVTPLRDGMNLVAKEYVASRIDDTGVLVLSEFAGASRELPSALLVNPHDVDGLVATLDRALRLGSREQRTMMRSMRRSVKGNDVFHWADSFLAALGPGAGSPRAAGKKVGRSADAVEPRVVVATRDRAEAAARP